MHISRRFRPLTLLLAAGSVPFLLAVSLPALRGAADHSASQVSTPQQVAETLDSIVQPRFQKNAGRFGADRVVQLDGHGDIHWTDAENRTERRRFAAVKAAHRSYIIAFLHCRHKPGAHIDPPTKPEPLEDFKPYTEALLTTGGTQAGAQRMVDWANKSLDPVVLPHLSQLKQGRPAETEYENWVVVMRPVRATHEACLTCHAGTRRGDTLGVMVYAVDKNAKIKGRTFEAPGGA